MFTPNWAWQEMRGARLDTPRRLPSLVLICQKLFHNAGKSLSAALGDATRQAAYDLFSRTERTPADLLAGHVQETVRRCQSQEEEEPILVVQDTVRLDYFTHRGCTGLGPVGEKSSWGLFGHAALALTGKDLPLGLLSLSLWTRDPAAYGSRHERKKRRPEEKETHIWLSTAREVHKVLPPPTPLILIQDREADVYPFLAEPRSPRTHIVVRAYQARQVRLLAGAPGAASPPEEKVDLTKAWEHVPVLLKEWTVTLPRQPGSVKAAAKKEREARVEVRASRVRLFACQKMPGAKQLPQSVEMIVLWVRELHPPAGEAPLFWMLLTSLPVNSPREALRVVSLYQQRWQIERLHRILKSGLRVERFQIDDAASLKNALAVCFIVAWRLLLVTQQARVAPETPASEWFTRSEREVLTAKFSDEARTLCEALRQVARYGGWPGASKKSVPGTDVLWRGFRDLAVAAEVWEIARQTFSAPPSPRDTS